MNVEGFIASRLFAVRNEGRRVSHTAVSIAVWGVAVGVMVMVLSVCIVLGFKGEIRRKVVGFGGHVELINRGSLYSSESLPIAFDDSLLSSIVGTGGVSHVELFCTKWGMLKTEGGFKGVKFKIGSA